MPSSPPLVVLLAGPNGAGKSTSAPDLLRGAFKVDEFVNADVIALGLSAYRPEAAAIAAGRVMLDRLHELARRRQDFAFETTLAGHGHAHWLRSLGSIGYRRHLIFLALPSANLAVARVAERVREGGHDVPEAVVRRRFAAGLENFFTHYQDVVDSWQVYDNSKLTSPRMIASRVGHAHPVIVDAGAWDRLRNNRQ